MLFVINCIIGCKESLPDSNPDDGERYIVLSAEFEDFLISKGIDNNSIPDGRIKYKNVKNIDSLNIYFDSIHSSLKGIENFTNLKYLRFRGRKPSIGEDSRYYYAFSSGLQPFTPSIDTLDVSKNLKLEYIDCSGGSDGGGYWSSIGYLKTGKNEKLKTLITEFSMIKSIDLRNLYLLETLNIGECYNLKLVSLCSNNNLKNLSSWQVDTFYVTSYGNVNPNWVIGKARFQICK